MKAWNKAVNAAAKDGINLPMSVTSSYRSPEQQQALIDAADAGDENAINPAPVGQSPHGQGWAIDIDYYSKANEWMRENGKKFGFQWQGEGDPVHFDFITTNLMINGYNLAKINGFLILMILLVHHHQVLLLLQQGGGRYFYYCTGTCQSQYQL